MRFLNHIVSLPGLWHIAWQMVLWGSIALLTPLKGQDIHTDTTRAQTLLGEANKLIQAGKIAETIPLAAESKALAKRHDLRDRYLLASNNQLKIMIYLGQLREARAEFDRDAAYVFPELDSTYKHVDFHLEVGYRLGEEFEDVAQMERYARVLLRRILTRDPLDSLQWAYALDRLAGVAKAQGDQAAALESRLQSYQIRKNHPDASPLDLSMSYFNLGQTYRDMGDMGLGLYYFQEGYEQTTYDPEKLRGQGNAAEFCNAIGLLYIETNQFETAEIWLQRGLAIRQAVYGAEHYECAKSLHNLSVLYADMNRFEEALALSKEALQIKEKRLGKYHPLVFSSLNNLAIYERMAGSLQRADSIHRRVMHIADSLYQPYDPNRSLYLTAWGGTFQRQDNLDSALWCYQRALEVEVPEFDGTDPYALPANVNIHDVTRIIILAERKARVFYARHQERPKPEAEDLHQAWRHVRYAISWADSLQRSFQDDASRRGLASKRQTIYKLAFEVAWALHSLDPAGPYAAEAFALSEKFKSGIAYARLQEQMARDLGGISPEIPAQERALSLEMARIRYDYQALGEAGEQAELKNQLFTLKLRQDSLIQVMETRFPQYYRLKYDVLVPALGAIQAALAVDELMLSYVWDDTVAWVWALGKNEWHWRKLTLRKGFEDRIRAFQAELQLEEGQAKAGPTAFHAQAYALYEELLQPLAAMYSPYNKLIISGGTGLSSWPFGVLATEPSGSQAAQSFADLPYLMKRHLIRQIYQAAQILPSVQSGRPSIDFFGVAPAYPGSDSNLIAAAALALRGEEGAFFAPLRYNQAEVSRISENWQGKIYLGEDATKERYMAEAGQASIIHLAMHGYAAPERPLYAGLVFAPKGDSVQDLAARWQRATLFGYEIFQQSLTAQLIVLSACQAGAGQWTTGEGVMSLARAFQFAGCPAVLSSLWRVDDAATAQLMVDFYDVLHQGAPKTAALQQAQLAYLARFPQAHPALWGGFVLIGADDPWRDPKPWLYWLGIGGVAVLIVILLAYIRQIQRKKLASEPIR